MMLNQLNIIISGTVIPKADKVLLSARLYIDALETKNKNKSFIKILNRIGPVM